MLTRHTLSLMLPSVAVRVVRGPNWCWDDQDGGEGGAGTVVEVGEGGNSVLVQWDGGTREWYRCGKDDKFDLRVLDTGPTGLKFPDVVCSGCYAEGVAGMHWKCAHCYEYHLCHSCYLLGRHYQEHPFFRVESEYSIKSTVAPNRRVMVSPRVGAKRVGARGIFPKAEVVRGHNWRFEDQDGGVGKIGTVEAIEGYQDKTARSIAKVVWSSTGMTNIYRVGHKGKVDLKCTTTGCGGQYYPEHLPTLGSDAPLVFFDEEEIVAGDVVTMELELEVFKVIQEANYLWEESMAQMGKISGIVVAVVENHEIMVYCIGKNLSMPTVCEAVSKMKHCKEGETVRITDDFALMYQQQSALLGNLWKDEMVTTLGQIGRVAQVNLSGTVEVLLQGRGWLYHPKCLLPAPGETARGDVDPQFRVVGIFVGNNKETLKDRMTAFDDKALLEGNLEAIANFLNSSHTNQLIGRLLSYYIATGMVPAVKKLLRSGADPNCEGQQGRLLIDSLVYDQTEASLALLEAGADVNVKHKRWGEVNPAMMAAAYGCSVRLLKAIAIHPQVLLDEQDMTGRTALHRAEQVSRHIGVAIFLAAKANPTVVTLPCVVNSIHEAAANGLIPVMEVLAVHGKDHLNSRTPDNGNTPLHYAAARGHSGVCHILAAQNKVDINAESFQNATALHLSAARGYWSVVECLVGWGASLTIADYQGNTSLHLVTRAKNDNFLNSPHLKMIHEALSRASGGKPVEGYLAVACFLMQEGADWLIKNNDGQSAHQLLPPGAVSLLAAYVKEHPGVFHGSLRGTHVQQRRLRELPQPLDLQTFACPTTEPPAETNTPTSPAPASPSPPGPQPCMLCEEQPASVKYSPCGHTVLCSLCAQRAKKCLKCKAIIVACHVVA